ncbi:MAG: patatin-like phospholipase family protein [Acidobacteria bacterium]|nr:patatin-like phospholipase family protein [Acidobacteriota bacterium]
MTPALTLRAGPRALSILRERGLRPEDVDVVAGASGGPKWLVLGGLDRYLFGSFLAGGRAPRALVGSSIGSWRMACLAQADPVAALARAQDAYIEQRYPKKPSAELVSETTAGILDVLLGPSGVDEILGNERARLHVITAEMRGLGASARRSALLAGLTFAVLGNVVSRRTLGLHTRRHVFHAGETSALPELSDLPTERHRLTAANLRSALLASASIPLVLEGVPVPGAPGIHRDGGVVDYHPAFDFGPGEGLVLYPHFYPYLVPGWFDKSLPWRRASGRSLDRVLVIAPSREFVARLPNGKIPDRNDFYELEDAARIAAWRGALTAGKAMAEELAELCASGRLAESVEPLSPGR